ncbi:uncharacterized protein CLUP02_08572 [Colletotrichum lupini]|uniref:Uncharacterized protein n=1 Tax=Colletotrichum lupini TaxID=145971 RepID=A0A9Q8SUK2_9PEZI|nr:uncharacterized protein CLUP02_08572 [Colletotrichum lupini]UQC83081.1 hypothetical protein CLUP02_08572 [Colletotrichum lupini]
MVDCYSPLVPFSSVEIPFGKSVTGYRYLILYRARWENGKTGTNGAFQYTSTHLNPRYLDLEGCKDKLHEAPYAPFRCDLGLLRMLLLTAVHGLLLLCVYEVCLSVVRLPTLVHGLTVVDGGYLTLVPFRNQGLVSTFAGGAVATTTVTSTSLFCMCFSLLSLSPSPLALDQDICFSINFSICHPRDHISHRLRAHPCFRRTPACDETGTVCTVPTTTSNLRLFYFRQAAWTAHTQSRLPSKYWRRSLATVSVQERSGRHYCVWTVSDTAFDNHLATIIHHFDHLTVWHWRIAPGLNRENNPSKDAAPTSPENGVLEQIGVCLGLVSWSVSGGVRPWELGTGNHPPATPKPQPWPSLIARTGRVQQPFVRVSQEPQNHPLATAFYGLRQPGRKRDDAYGYLGPGRRSTCWSASSGQPSIPKQARRPSCWDDFRPPSRFGTIIPSKVTIELSGATAIHHFGRVRAGASPTGPNLALAETMCTKLQGISHGSSTFEANLDISDNWRDSGAASGARSIFAEDRNELHSPAFWASLRKFNYQTTYAKRLVVSGEPISDRAACFSRPRGPVPFPNFPLSPWSSDLIQCGGASENHVVSSPEQPYMEPLANHLMKSPNTTASRCYFRGSGNAVPVSLTRDTMVEDEDHFFCRLISPSGKPIPLALRYSLFSAFFQPTDDTRWHERPSQLRSQAGPIQRRVVEWDDGLNHCANDYSRSRSPTARLDSGVSSAMTLFGFLLEALREPPKAVDDGPFSSASVKNGLLFMAHGEIKVPGSYGCLCFWLGTLGSASSVGTESATYLLCVPDRSTHHRQVSSGRGRGEEEDEPNKCFASSASRMPLASWEILFPERRGPESYALRPRRWRGTRKIEKGPRSTLRSQFLRPRHRGRRVGVSSKLSSSAWTSGERRQKTDQRERTAKIPFLRSLVTLLEFEFKSVKGLWSRTWPAIFPLDIETPIFIDTSCKLSSILDEDASRVDLGGSAIDLMLNMFPLAFNSGVFVITPLITARYVEQNGSPPPDKIMLNQVPGACTYPVLFHPRFVAIEWYVCGTPPPRVSKSCFPSSLKKRTRFS